jgi:hypothetical protein
MPRLSATAVRKLLTAGKYLVQIGLEDADGVPCRASRGLSCSESHDEVVNLGEVLPVLPTLVRSFQVVNLGEVLPVRSFR